MSIMNHIAEAPVTAPSDADDVPTVLARLIEGALAPALALADLRVAAMVVERTRERIGEELYLVPHAAED
jgi:hypothetical protein